MRLLDIVDILLVGILLYQVYRLLRGSLAFNIFLGFLLVYLVYLMVQTLEMNLLAGILGQFIGVGVIALLIVFQPEIRRFLLYIGRGTGIGKDQFWKNLFVREKGADTSLQVHKEQIMRAVNNMATTKTGALIVFVDASEQPFFANTGSKLNADISGRLIESLFHKGSPLHDGAIVIAEDKIFAAGCVLPVSENPDLPTSIGMRHRAAVGITEHIDARVVIVSEETGKISIAARGKIRQQVSQTSLDIAILGGLQGRF